MKTTIDFTWFICGIILLAIAFDIILYSNINIFLVIAVPVVAIIGLLIHKWKRKYSLDKERDEY